jgi:prephenate dehydratase
MVMSIKYAYLGPAGTFTQAALQKIADSSDELIDMQM